MAQRHGHPNPYQPSNWRPSKIAALELRIFAIALLQQSTERISSSQVRKMFGMTEVVEEMVILRRM